MVGFRKSKKFGPLRFTASKRGLSASAGAGPLRVTRRADGRYQRTVRIPGTGIYDTKIVGTGPGGNRHATGSAPGVAPGAGWYPDPAGGPGQKYWDGVLWHDAVPATPGIPTPEKPPRRVSTKALMIAAVAFVAVVVIGNAIESRKDARDERETRSSPSSSSALAAPSKPVQLPAAPTLSPDELKDAEFSALLIRRGVDFTPVERDDMILQGHAVCVFLAQPGPKPTMMDAGLGLMDTYGHTANDAAAIAASAVQVYCPEQER